MSILTTATTTNVTVGFGTAGLGGQCYNVVLDALAAGFRRFDTAEADWWYDQASVGKALHDFVSCETDDEDYYCRKELSKYCDSLDISTKIPPWELTTIPHMRQTAQQSQQTLLGFCDKPLDVYYIHAPSCWKGWHPKCEAAPETMDLRHAWMGMEYVRDDQTTNRIGLSNVWPNQLLDIIAFVQSRDPQSVPTPHLPDVVQAYADPLSSNDELRQLCATHNIEFVSYSTLGTQHREAVNPVLTHSVVLELAQQYSKSTAEIVLSWALQNNMSIIPRSSKQSHIQELARLLETGGFLSDKDVTKMNQLKR